MQRIKKHWVTMGIGIFIIALLNGAVALPAYKEWSKQSASAPVAQLSQVPEEDMVPIQFGAGPSWIFEPSLLPQADNTYTLGITSKRWKDIFIATSTAGCAQFSSLGLLFSTGTNCGAGSGTITAVTGTYPISSSGGTTPNISTVATSTDIYPLVFSANTNSISFAGLSTTSPWVTGQSAFVNANGNISSTPTTTAGCAGTASCSQFVVFGNTPVTITGAAAAVAGDPFPLHTPVYGQTTSGTSTLVAFTGFPYSLVASSTVNFVNASSTNETISSNLFLPYIAKFQLLETDANSRVIATTSIGTNLLTANTIALTDSNSTITVGASPATLGGTITATLNLANSNQWTASTTFTKVVNMQNASSSLNTLNTIWIPTILSGLLSTDQNGKVVASTTIGSNLLSVSSLTVNTTAPLTGGGTVALGGTLTIACATCPNGLLTDPFTHVSVYGQTTSATSTLIALTGFPYSLVASSTVQLVNASTTNLTVFSGEWHPGIAASSILALDNTNKMVASTTIGSNLLSASGITAGSCTNCNITFTAQGIATAQSSGAGATTLGYIPWGGSIVTTFGTTTIASTTPANFLMGFYASSTSQIAYASTSALSASSELYSTTASTTNAIISSQRGVLLSAAMNGTVQATTSVGMNYLSGILPVSQGGTGANTLTGVTIGNGTGAFTVASTQTCSNQFIRVLSASYAATCASVSLVNDITGTLGVPNGGSGATAFNQGFIYSAGGTTALTASTSGITIDHLIATSTTASSTIAADLWVKGVGNFPNAYVLIGTSSPGFGRVSGGLLDVVLYRGDQTAAVNAFNGSKGACASSGFFADGDILAVSSDYSFFGFLNSGWTGAGCAIGNGLEKPEDTVISNPTGSHNYEMASTSASVAFKWYTKNTTLSMILNNGTGNLGISTSTPGTLLSIGNTTGVNIGTATSTWSTGSGINLTGGCFAIKGSCLTLSTITGTLPVAGGGTGAVTLTGVLQGNGTGAVTTITDSSTVGQVLRVTGAASYAWGALNLASANAVTGTLAETNGGTGTTTAPTGQLLYGGAGGVYQSTPTTTASCTGTVSCTAFTIIGSNSITITGSASGGSAADSFTHGSVYGQTTSATSTLLSLTGFPFSLAASGTVAMVNASTTNFTVFGNEYWPNLTNALLSTDPSGIVSATTTPTAQRFMGTSLTFPSFFPLASTTALTVSTNAYLPGNSAWNTGGVGINDLTPDFKLESVGVNNLGYFGLSNVSEGDVVVVNAAGQVGIGTSTPWATFSVASSTYNGNLNAPIVAVATSSNAFGFLIGIWATSSVLQSLQNPRNFVLDSGARVAIGTTRSYDYPGLLDQLTVNGRVNTGDWKNLKCILGQNLTGSDALYGCGDFMFQLDTTGNMQPQVTGGLNQTLICAQAVGNCTTVTNKEQANTGVGLFWPASSFQAPAIISATNTPVLEGVQRIDFPQNATSTAFYFGFSNINPTGTTFEIEPTVGCYFVASTTIATGNWQAICRTSAAAETIVDTGFASSTNIVGTGSYQRFRIEMDNIGATFYMGSSTSPLHKVAYISTNYPNTTAMYAGTFTSRIAIAGFDAPLDINSVNLYIYQPALNY